MRIFDISLPIDKSLDFILWPTSPTISVTKEKTFSQKEQFNLTNIFMPTQVATHIDAPLHYLENGQDASELPLEPFIGKCFVLDLSKIKSREILADDLKYIPHTVSIIVIKTISSYSWKEKKFPTSFPWFSENAIEFLASRHFNLIGTDSPSIDKIDSKLLKAHKRAYEKNIYILESLNLYHINEGIYELIALPLALVDCDASPVRAILRTLDDL